MSTEREMLDRLNRKYAVYNANGFRYTRAEHVKIATGFTETGGGMRICDYMAMDLWNGYGRGAGPKLHGHEVKVSRSDWLAELKDPSKAEAFAQYCDYWWLVVWDPATVKDGELPRGWGLIAASGNGLRVKKQATRRPEPVPMGRPLQATFSRAVTKTALRLHHQEDAALRYIGNRMGLVP